MEGYILFSITVQTLLLFILVLQGEIREKKINTKETEIGKMLPIAAEQEAPIMRDKPRVQILLKNNSLLTVYDADDYIIDSEYVKIEKGNYVIASVKLDEVLAISLNPIRIKSVGHEEIRG